jgi:hypothetical protein
MVTSRAEAALVVGFIVTVALFTGGVLGVLGRVVKQQSKIAFSARHPIDITKHLGTNALALYREQQALAKTLTPGVYMQVIAENGDVYYENTVTGERAWQCPDGSRAIR